MSKQIITKQCSKCKDSKPLSEFYKRSKSKDGFQNRCKSCKNAIDMNYRKTPKSKAIQKHSRQSKKYKIYQKQYNKQYAQTENGKEIIRNADRKHRKTTKGKTTHSKAIYRYNARHPERIEARKAVKEAIEVGKLPQVNTLQCHYCPAQAGQYHHWSYAPEHWLDVLPVCIPCHSKIYSKKVI